MDQPLWWDAVAQQAARRRPSKGSLNGQALLLVARCASRVMGGTICSMHVQHASIGCESCIVPLSRMAPYFMASSADVWTTNEIKVKPPSSTQCGHQCDCLSTFASEAPVGFGSSLRPMTWMWVAACTVQPHRFSRVSDGKGVARMVEHLQMREW